MKVNTGVAAGVGGAKAGVAKFGLCGPHHAKLALKSSLWSFNNVLQRTFSYGGHMTLYEGA